ncbi:MAG: HAD hydrolase-like protein [Chloroflexota bacterium]
MPYKMAIFDFDGTLADSFPWVVSVFDQVAEKYHLAGLGQGEVERLRRQGARQIIKERRVPFWKILPIANYVRRLMAENIHHIRMFDGVDGLLRSLAAHGLLLGLVTSNTHPNVCRVLGAERTGLFHFNECSVSPFGKPGRLKKLLRKGGVQPHEAIYIGDEIRDLEAARKVRMPFGAVAWGYTHPDALEAHAPHEMFASVAEIPLKIGYTAPAVSRHTR